MPPSKVRNNPASSPPCTAPTSAKTFAAGSLLFGVTGWAVENVYAPPRYSWVVGGRATKVPFLPIYAAGGAGVLLAMPHLQKLPLPVRFALYAAGLTSLEYLACKAEHQLGRSSWDYSGQCIDTPHALAWGTLGLVAEQMGKTLREQQPTCATKR